MGRTRKAVRKKSSLETQIVEHSKVLSSYGYCELPAHFFDRALHSPSSKPVVLTVAPWSGRDASSSGAR